MEQEVENADRGALTLQHMHAHVVAGGRVRNLCENDGRAAGVPSIRAKVDLCNFSACYPSYAMTDTVCSHFVGTS
jgi:hypothetical protein